MTAPTIALPDPDGGRISVTLGDPGDFHRPSAPFSARQVFAAPHVVSDALADYTPGLSPPVDWDATMAYRRHLWSYGIGVAEAMDTSERGPGGLTWGQTQELIRRSVAEAAAVGGEIVAGAGTDHLVDPDPSLDDIARAYLEQASFIEGLGCSTVLRASHALAGSAHDAADYARVYDHVLSGLERPAIVHWIGEVFDPALRSYWGSDDVDQAMKHALELAHRHVDHLRGFKFSLLDAERERTFRNELPEGVVVLTGDDHDYPSLIRGDADGHSHGLLGVFDPLAPIASRAMQALESGDQDTFQATLDASTPFARRVFETPAGDYKTGVVFMAYLAGHQDHFRMVTGREGMRSMRHLCEVFQHADRLRLLPDPDLAAARMRSVLAVAGWDA